jgi:uncharacterized membrane protein YfcA
VPVLILFACALMVLRPKPRLRHGAMSRHRKLALGGIGFAVGVYGGYFGAAQGVILLGAMRFPIPDSLQRLNGLGNGVVGIANGVAAILFMIVAHVAWDAAALVGGRLGLRRPDRRPLRPPDPRGKAALDGGDGRRRGRDRALRQVGIRSRSSRRRSGPARPG